MLQSSLCWWFIPGLAALLGCGSTSADVPLGLNVATERAPASARIPDADDLSTAPGRDGILLDQEQFEDAPSDESADPAPAPGTLLETDIEDSPTQEPASTETAADDPATPNEPESEASGPVVLTVAKDGSGDHPSISAAIRAADYLDEIRIMPGSYNEAVVLDRRVTLTRGPGTGPVIIDGGASPALTLDRVTMIEVNDLILRGGDDALAAIVVKQGQLKLSSCRLDASPNSAAAGASRAGAQLIMVDCVIRAGEGSALAFHPEARGALESCRFSWTPDNPMPFIDPEDIPVLTMRNCVFGRKTIEGPFLVSTNLLSMLPADGSPTLYVQPDRDQWPHWATRDETHFESLTLAIDRAPAGSHVLVSPGTYREQVGIVKPLTITSTGSSGEVLLETVGESALWINASAKVVLQGLSIRASVGQSIPAVQINGGQVELIDCRIDNEAGHGLIVTSNHAASHLTMSGCQLFSSNKAVYATGETTTLNLKDCHLAGESIALFMMNGATSEVRNSTFDSDRYAVELWGPTASARLEGCTILRAGQVLAFNEGASRSQVQTAGLIVK